MSFDMLQKSSQHSGKHCYLQIFARSIVDTPAIVIADFLHGSVITDNTRIFPVQRVTVTQSPADLTALCQGSLVTKTIHIIHPDNATSYNNNKNTLLHPLYITAPFNNMRNLNFKAQPTNALFATVNQMFGGSSSVRLFPSAR